MTVGTLGQEEEMLWFLTVGAGNNSHEEEQGARMKNEYWRMKNAKCMAQINIHNLQSPFYIIQSTFLAGDFIDPA
jgi:hypothetical protein